MGEIADAGFGLPTAGQVVALARQKGWGPEKAAAELLAARDQVIADAKRDPFRYGMEPPIWWVYDALTDFPTCTAMVLAHLAWRMGRPAERVWEEFKGKMRECLGFADPVRHVLVSGANRSGKSEMAAKRSIQLAVGKDDARVWALFMKQEASQEKQQPLYWKYLPCEWQRDNRSGHPTYIGYKSATGFSESRFVLPNGSYVGFRYYSQDVGETAEGGEVDLAAPDELMPLEWVDALIKRTSTRNGRILLTFTPIDGYTPTVAVWQSGMQVVRWAPAYVLPTDNGAPLPHLALGLTAEEYAELEAADREKRVPRAPESRPEDVVAWMEDQRSEVRDQRSEVRGQRSEVRGQGSEVRGQIHSDAEGRSFELAPRVAKCVNPDMAVIWFHPMDNPYGYPRRVVKDNLAAAVRKGRDEVRCRVYGIAVKQFQMKFPKFDVAVHVVPDAQIPKQGWNYNLMDPAGGRNFAMAWFRSTKMCDYVYREWPGEYEIPGVGVPGPWAKPSGRKMGRNDGDMDDGQKDFGWGLDRYQYEIARLERWEDWKRWWLASGQDFDAVAGDDDMLGWEDGHGAEEVMELRLMDSRPAVAQIRVGGSDMTSLIEEMNKRGMNWIQAPGLSVEEGVAMINDAMDFERDAAGRVVRQPKLKIAASCKNLIFALTQWQNADGKTGATKDFVDLVRYFFQAGLSLGNGARELRSYGGTSHNAGGRGANNELAQRARNAIVEEIGRGPVEGGTTGRCVKRAGGRGGGR
jgi:hypothetical protein